MDYSTLNLDRLRSLRTYKLPSTYNLQEEPGNSCAGDPPGYPTYYTRSVYTQSGNNPRRGPQMVISFEGVNYVVNDGKDDYDAVNQRLHKLWLPLPIDHPRTRLWIIGTYRHHKHCYNGFGNDMVIYPVPYYKKKAYTDDPKWKDEYCVAHRAEVDAFNKQLEDQAKELATPDNHNVVRIIRKFYPDYQPELDLIANPPEKHVGAWWETEAQQPSEEDCARTQRWGHRHPFNGLWCQWCGRHYEKGTVKE